MPKVILQSSDQKTFPVEVDVARMSTTIKTKLEDLRVSGDEGKEVKITLPEVEGDILQKVIQWAEQHKDDPASPQDDVPREGRTYDIGQWDQDFLKVKQATLFDLMLAAKNLDIKGLMDVTCKTLANMTNGKTAEEMRRLFNIRNDFTAAEEEHIRKENEFCIEK